MYAGVAELADAPDLGSGVTDMQVQVLSPAPAGSACTQLSTVCSAMPSFIPRWHGSDLIPNVPPAASCRPTMFGDVQCDAKLHITMVVFGFNSECSTGSPKRLFLSVLGCFFIRKINKTLKQMIKNYEKYFFVPNVYLLYFFAGSLYLH